MHLFHEWTEWTYPTPLTAVSGNGTMQSRTCLKCGLVQAREVHRGILGKHHGYFESRSLRQFKSEEQKKQIDQMRKDIEASVATWKGIKDDEHSGD